MEVLFLSFQLSETLAQKKKTNANVSPYGGTGENNHCIHRPVNVLFEGVFMLSLKNRCASLVAVFLLKKNPPVTGDS